MSFSKECFEAVTDVWERYRDFSGRRGALKELKKRPKIYRSISLSDEEKQLIDDLYEKNYGKRVPYGWHRYFYTVSGRFTPEYITGIAFNAEFEQYENYNRSYRDVLADKNFLPLIAKGTGIRTPVTVLAGNRGIYQDHRGRFVAKEEVERILDRAGRVFVKPSLNSSEGKECFEVKFVDGVDEISGTRVEDFLNCMKADFVIQEYIECSDDLCKLHNRSVNTFRICSYRWKDEIRICPIVLRMGVGNSCVDNASAGGIYIGVEENGNLLSKAHY